MLKKVLGHLRRNPFKTLFGLVVLLVLCWLLASFAACFALTRRHHRPFAEPPPDIAWARLDSVRLHTNDGEEIGAWFSRGPDDGASVLLLHGNGGSRRNSLPLAELFSSQGCSVLAVSLRAHGDSSGEFNDIGYSARHDVVAAVEYLEHERPGRPIVIQGISLGAAAAVYAAGDLGTRVSGYILESPYLDIRTAVRNRISIYFPVVLDQVANAGVEVAGPCFLPHVDDMSPLERIGDVPSEVPILLLAGSRDERAPPDQIEEIQQRVHEHSRFVVFEGAGHEMFCLSNPEEYRKEVTPFIERAIHHP